MLHIVNKSSFEKTTLASCLRVAASGSALLLIEDAVYAALRGARSEGAVREAQARLKVYALEPDLRARGLESMRVIEDVALIDYGQFVDLTLAHDKVMSWT